MRERSKTAARSRREKENVEFTELGKLLPLPANVTSHLDKASIIRLTTSYLKMRQLFPRGLGDDWGSENVSAKDGNSILKELSSHLLLSLDGFIFVLDAAAKIIYVSETASVHLGLSQIELTGNSIFDFIHSSDHEEMKSILYYQGIIPQCELMTEDIEIQLSFCVRMKCVLAKRNAGLATEGYKVIHCSGYLKLRKTHVAEEFHFIGHQPSQSKQYQVVGLVAIGQSVPSSAVTEVKMASHMFMFRVSLDFTFINVDARIKSLAGYEPQSMIDKTLYQFVHGADCLQLQSDHRSILLKGQVITKYYRLLTRSGGWIWIQSNCIMIHGNKPSKRHCILALNHVISDREHSEEIVDAEQLHDGKLHSSYKLKNLSIPSPKMSNMGHSFFPTDLPKFAISDIQKDCSCMLRDAHPVKQTGREFPKRKELSENDAREIKNKNSCQLTHPATGTSSGNVSMNSKSLINSTKNCVNGYQQLMCGNDELACSIASSMYANIISSNVKSLNITESNKTVGYSRHVTNFSAILDKNNRTEFNNVCEATERSFITKDIFPRSNELKCREPFQTPSAAASRFDIKLTYLSSDTEYIFPEFTPAYNFGTFKGQESNDMPDRGTKKSFKRSIVGKQSCSKDKPKYSKTSNFCLMNDKNITISFDKEKDNVSENSLRDIFCERENAPANEVHQYSENDNCHGVSFNSHEKTDALMNISDSIDMPAFPSQFNFIPVLAENAAISQVIESENSSILVHSICQEMLNLQNYGSSGENSNLHTNTGTESIYYSNETCGSFDLNEGVHSRHISGHSTFSSDSISSSIGNTDLPETFHSISEAICNISKDCRFTENCDISPISYRTQSVGDETLSIASTSPSNDVFTDNCSIATTPADNDYRRLSSSSPSLITNLDLKNPNINGSQNIPSNFSASNDASMLLSSNMQSNSFSTLSVNLFEDYPGTIPIFPSEYFPHIEYNWLSNTSLDSSSSTDKISNTNMLYPQQNSNITNPSLASVYPSTSLPQFEIQNH